MGAGALVSGSSIAFLISVSAHVMSLVTSTCFFFFGATNSNSRDFREGVRLNQFSREFLQTRPFRIWQTVQNRTKQNSR
jgi:hypothetical protein